MMQDCRNYDKCNIHHNLCNSQCQLHNKSCFNCEDWEVVDNAGICKHNGKNIGLNDMPCKRYPGAEI